MIVEESQKATKNISAFKVRQYSCRVQNLKENSNQVNPIFKKNAPKIKHTIAAARLHKAVTQVVRLGYCIFISSDFLMRK